MSGLIVAVLQFLLLKSPFFGLFVLLDPCLISEVFLCSMMMMISMWFVVFWDFILKLWVKLKFYCMHWQVLRSHDNFFLWVFISIVIIVGLMKLGLCCLGGFFVAWLFFFLLVLLVLGFYLRMNNSYSTEWKKQTIKYIRVLFSACELLLWLQFFLT